jgi:hypothetical protein
MVDLGQKRWTLVHLFSFLVPLKKETFKHRLTIHSEIGLTRTPLPLMSAHLMNSFQMNKKKTNLLKSAFL